MKQLTLTVDESMEGQTLDQVLKAGLGLTRKQISQAKFRSRGITMDGAQIRTTYVCRTGQELRVCVEEDREDTGRVMPGAGVLDILYEDSLGSRLAAYFTEKGRTDTGTSHRKAGSGYFGDYGVCQKSDCGRKIEFTETRWQLSERVSGFCGGIFPYQNRADQEANQKNAGREAQDVCG